MSAARSKELDKTLQQALEFADDSEMQAALKAQRFRFEIIATKADQVSEVDAVELADGAWGLRRIDMSNLLHKYCGYVVNSRQQKVRNARQH